MRYVHEGSRKRPAKEYTAVSHPSPVSEPTPTEAADVFGNRVELAKAYHHLLASVAAERGFIGPKEVPRLWSRHILNCAVISEAFDKHQRVADIGSGAGLPGIALAIARPDLELTLIEPLLKRSTFLSEVVGELGLSNVAVVRGRAEEQKKAAFDVVTSRAVAPLGKLATWSLPLAKVGGAMIAMKGASVAEELARDAPEIRRVGGDAGEIFHAGTSILEQPTTLIRIGRTR